ncbi:Octamer-binding transcription factor [Parasponia andersonii]|uniref:Octamer-binding transcription factor n=1 Tax=Parasponia andersonii TaxID=3476 RepID=A0A2P5DQL7_PARAD|nr:Octamer-binding transcription factor [Parasponia andersonii]
MVLQKRLDYGFNGYQVPAMPRATRSARRRGTVRRRVEENQMCAFDLLATVAGNLLLEKESTPTSSNTSNQKDKCSIVNQDEQDGNKTLKVEPCDQGSCDKNFFVSENVSHAPNVNHSSKESSFPQNDDHSGFTSIMTTSNCTERLVAKNSDNGKIKNEVGSFCSQIEEGLSMYRESGGCELQGEAKTLVKDESNSTGKVLTGTVPDMCSSEYPAPFKGKPPAMPSSDSSPKAPLCGDHDPLSLLPSHRDNVKVVSRDDDENSSGCTHPSTTSRYFKRASRIGDRRIRKILASKHWKFGSKFKDETLSNPDGFIKPIYRSRKDCYKRQRAQMNVPFKKRKLFDHSTVWTSDGGTNNHGFFNSTEKGIGDASASCPKLQGGTGKSCSVSGQHTSFQCRDSHVKLRIKSFRVPELFIEIPETATVGSLKRTVMEAVTAILGGGLHIGVLLKGNKVRDDNITLLQSGISHDNQLDALGFTLEPNLSQSPPPLCSGDSPHLLPGDAPQLLARSPHNQDIVDHVSANVPPESHVACLGNLVESDHDSAPSPTETSVDKSTTDSKALVPVPAMSVEALSVVPALRKSNRSEIAQRRIRRPFSVSEVEALVQAVEKLGTGRWRDVKLRAFDNAKHRTYVDLKDKWKTLVHTARISPQQRRGEPVPQELLDRVLCAHAYWSQQQAKQQLKQQPETCLLL